MELDEFNESTLPSIPVIITGSSRRKDQFKIKDYITRIVSVNDNIIKQNHTILFIFVQMKKLKELGKNVIM